MKQTLENCRGDLRRQKNLRDEAEKKKDKEKTLRKLIEKESLQKSKEIGKLKRMIASGGGTGNSNSGGDGGGNNSSKNTVSAPPRNNKTNNADDRLNFASDFDKYKENEKKANNLMRQFSKKRPLTNSNLSDSSNKPKLPMKAKKVKTEQNFAFFQTMGDVDLGQSSDEEHTTTAKSLGAVPVRNTAKPTLSRSTSKSTSSGLVTKKRSGYLPLTKTKK